MCAFPAAERIRHQQHGGQRTDRRVPGVASPSPASRRPIAPAATAAGGYRRPYSTHGRTRRWQQPQDELLPRSDSAGGPSQSVGSRRTTRDGGSTRGRETRRNVEKQRQGQRLRRLGQQPEGCRRRQAGVAEPRRQTGKRKVANIKYSLRHFYVLYGLLTYLLGSKFPTTNALMAILSSAGDRKR